MPRGSTADPPHVESLSGAKRAPGGQNERRCGVDRALAELAEAQHGVVGRRQLLAAGVGRRTIGCRLERGALHSVERGVYAVGHAVLSTRARWMAAVLALGPGTMLSHRSAGELWGIVPRSGHAIEVTRSTRARNRSRIVTHESAVPPDERTSVDAIPVTCLSRTLLDLAAVASRRQVEKALNESEVLGLTDRLSIPDLLARYPRRPGSAMLRALLADDAGALGIPRNDLEEGFAALLVAHGLPRPRFNVDLAVAGRLYNVDCLWAGARLIVELDGRAVHATRRAFEADRERDRLMLVDGWRVMRVTWLQLRHDGPALAEDLRRALARTAR